MFSASKLSVQQTNKNVIIGSSEPAEYFTVECVDHILLNLVESPSIDKTVHLTTTFQTWSFPSLDTFLGDDSNLAPLRVYVPRAPVYYTHLDVYKRQVLYYNINYCYVMFIDYAEVTHIEC